MELPVPDPCRGDSASVLALRFGKSLGASSADLIAPNAGSSGEASPREHEQLEKQEDQHRLARRLQAAPVDERLVTVNCTRRFIRNERRRAGSTGRTRPETARG